LVAGLNRAIGEIVAVNQETGTVAWDNKLPSSLYGATPVTNNVVFTTTYHGNLDAFNATTGRPCAPFRCPPGQMRGRHRR
jgi:outer membrane protein assembly factor BamB